MRIVNHRGKWAARIGGKRYSTGFAATEDNRDAAERAADHIGREIAAAQAENKCGPIIRAYLKDMPNRAKPRVVSPQQQNVADKVAKYFEDMTPAEVTRDICRLYLTKNREVGLSDQTTRNRLSTLRAALKWKDPNTPAVFELPPPSEPRDEWLTRDQFAKLLKEAVAPHIQLFLHIAICTGARKEAILNMQWETHIDFEKGTIWPGFKQSGKARSKPIPMTQAAKTALQNAYQVSTCPWVIEHGGDQVKDVKRGLRAAYERAEIETTAPAHVIRHTAGAWMAIAGVPMFEISRRLGHKSQVTTEKHYAHLHPDYMEKSTQALEV